MFQKLNVFILLLILFLTLTPTVVLAAGTEQQFNQANQSVQKAINSLQSNDVESAKNHFQNFYRTWFDLESEVKMQSPSL